MARIAFIGLGNMGGPMSANLAKAQHRVIGFDLATQTCRTAESNGVTIAESAQAAVRDADVVFTMLPAGQHVVSVWQDVVTSVPKGALMIDCSTIDVGNARAAHALAAARGLEAVDAPVSGGVVGAQAGTLTLMVGGSAAAFARAKPFLEGVGRRVVHCGEAGMGQAAKICNNMMAGIQTLAVCEAFILAERIGLTHEALFEVASSSSGQGFALSKYCPVPGLVPATPASNGYKPGFAAALMLKDLKLAQDAAASVAVSTPLGAHAAQLCQLFVSAGNGGVDYTGIIEYLRGRSVT